jgi:hypothetical protein
VVLRSSMLSNSARMSVSIVASHARASACHLLVEGFDVVR